MVQTQGERVTAALRSKIESGQLRPGEVLPTIPQLRQEYGVGVGPVRAALATLRTLGLTEFRSGVGNVVRER